MPQDFTQTKKIAKQGWLLQGGSGGNKGDEWKLKEWSGKRRPSPHCKPRKRIDEEAVQDLESSTLYINAS